MGALRARPRAGHPHPAHAHCRRPAPSPRVGVPPARARGAPGTRRKTDGATKTEELVLLGIRGGCKAGQERPGWRGVQKHGWAVSGASESCELDSDEGRERPLQPCTFTPKRCSCSPPGLAACMQRARCSYRRRLDRPGDGRVEFGGSGERLKRIQRMGGWVGVANYPFRGWMVQSMHLLPIRAGKGFVGPALTPQILPELTADGAPESSLFFIRLPGSGKGKARGGMEGGMEERWSSQGLLPPPPCRPRITAGCRSPRDGALGAEPLLAAPRSSLSK